MNDDAVKTSITGALVIPATRRPRTSIASTPAAPSRRERRKQITRAELIRAGRTLFGERGLYEVRIEDLAERADIAKGTVYLYFSGKMELIEAVVGEGIAALQGRVRSETDGASTPADYAERVAVAHFRLFAEQPHLMRIFHQLRGMLAFRQAGSRPLRSLLEKHIEFLAAGMARSRGPGRTVGARDRDLAVAAFGYVSGVTSMYAALNASPSRSATEDCRSALAWLAKRPAPGPRARAGKPRRSRAGSS
jgi:AcrR family transcriptional regulator